MTKAIRLKRWFGAFWRLFMAVAAQFQLVQFQLVQFQLVQFQLVQTRAVLEATLRLRALLGRDRHTAVVRAAGSCFVWKARGTGTRGIEAGDIAGRVGRLAVYASFKL